MILGLGKLAMVYLLILVSGGRIVSRLPLCDSLGRCLMMLAFGAAQLQLSIQILSLFRQLTGDGLLLMNAACTAAIFAGTRRWPPARGSRSPPVQALLLAFVGAHRLESAVLVVSVLTVLGSALTGALIYPMTDYYHFSSPQFWKQHATILPFPAYDPRLIAMAFGSEALTFPGFLYARTGVMCAVLAGLAGLMLIWITAAIARQLGASPQASATAGALVAGLGPVPVTLFCAAADTLMPAMWFGGAVYFLLQSRGVETGELQPLELACSIGCLLLACGTKNIVVLQTPSYLAVAALLHGRRLFSRPSVQAMLGAGVAGLLASGLLWNYVSNLRWFGDFRGDKHLKETISTEMGPQAIWTRLTRAAVTVAFDVIWVPKRYQEDYANFSVRAVRAMGGQERLAEDVAFYAFTYDGPRPGRGLGPLGILLFWPAVAGALFGWLRQGPVVQSEHRRFPAEVALAILTLGSFLTGYIVLRWQSIGTTRMMIACLMPGAALVALLLEKSWIRLAANGLLAACLLAYFTFGLGLAIRRLDLKDRFWLASKIAGLQREHSERVDYRWHDGPAGSLQRREDYTAREVYLLMLSRIPQPAVIGLAGSFWSEGYFLFGKDLSNTVVSLTDSRFPAQLLRPTADVEFIVVDNHELRDSDKERLEEFDLWFESRTATRPVITVFKRRNIPAR